MIALRRILDCLRRSEPASLMGSPLLGLQRLIETIIYGRTSSIAKLPRNPYFYREFGARPCSLPPSVFLTSWRLSIVKLETSQIRAVNSGSRIRHHASRGTDD